MAGRPRDPNHRTVLERIAKKKQLRSQIRLEEARRRNKKIMAVASALVHDRTTFYKLVKAQRSTKTTNTTELVVDSKVLNTDGELCEG